MLAASGACSWWGPCGRCHCPPAQAQSPTAPPPSVLSFVAAVIESFEDVIEQHVALSFFVPLGEAARTCAGTLCAGLQAARHTAGWPCVGAEQVACMRASVYANVGRG